MLSNPPWTLAKVKIFPLVHRLMRRLEKPRHNFDFTANNRRDLSSRTADAYRCSGEKRNIQRLPIVNVETEGVLCVTTIFHFFFSSRPYGDNVGLSITISSTSFATLTRRYEFAVPSRAARYNEQSSRYGTCNIDWYIGTIFDTQWGGSLKSHFISHLYKLHFFSR